LWRRGWQPAVLQTQSGLQYNAPCTTACLCLRTSNHRQPGGPAHHPHHTCGSRGALCLLCALSFDTHPALLHSAPCLCWCMVLSPELGGVTSASVSCLAACLCYTYLVWYPGHGWCAAAQSCLPPKYTAHAALAVSSWLGCALCSTRKHTLARTGVTYGLFLFPSPCKGIWVCLCLLVPHWTSQCFA
jgi:hypothetical protein